MEKEKQMNKQKVKDLAVWKSFSEQKQSKAYKVAGNENSGYYLIPVSKSENVTHCYTNMDFEHIRAIRKDIDPPPHWEEITGMFSIADGEVLRFILKHQVPLEKFIRFELAARGYDEEHQWVGFDMAERMWLK